VHDPILSVFLTYLRDQGSHPKVLTHIPREGLSQGGGGECDACSENMTHPAEHCYATHTNVFLASGEEAGNECAHLHSSKPITSHCTCDSNSTRDLDNFQSCNSCITVGMKSARRRDFK
jgi:hypothetical protein